MGLASILLVVAIAAAGIGFNGFYTGLCYAIFYATLGFLGVHLLLSAIDEDVHVRRMSDREVSNKAMPNSLAKS